VVVLKDGAVVGELAGDDVTEEKLMHTIAGDTPAEPAKEVANDG
jgi:ribose transport system ATP-binding protein